MESLGDNVVMTPGLIKGERYSFLIESKTALFVQTPDVLEASSPARGFPLFILAFSVASIIGISLNQTAEVLMMPLIVVAIAAAWSLIKSFWKPVRDEGKWCLYLGSAEPVLIYSSFDGEIFEAKRNEIEQTLLGRPLNEEV